MQNHTVTNVDEAFYALADPTRRAVLDLLRRGGQPAGQIAESFPVSRPAISKHLRVLLDASLVHERREGRNRVYELSAQPLKTVDQWLTPYRELWGRKLEDLKAFVESEERAVRSPSSGRRRARRRR
jgi:DNA-binding transcriptional ArsR family regulator